jgi:hypothetical protein
LTTCAVAVELEVDLLLDVVEEDVLDDEADAVLVWELELEHPARTSVAKAIEPIVT